MTKKVQKVGINKDALLKFHRELALNLSNSRNLKFSDDKLDEFSEFALMHSRVLLFGISEIDNLDLSYKTAIYNHFDPTFDGLNELIKKEPYSKNYEAVSDWLLEKMKFAERFLLRASPVDKVEQKFISVIDKLETFLQSEYAKVLLPLLIKIEDEVKDEISRIYSLDLTAEEKEKLGLDFLDKKEEESLKLFQGEIENNLNDKAYQEFLLILPILGLEKPSQDLIDTELKKTEFDYLSNVKAFFSNSMRRVSEVFFKNIYSRRDLKQEQAKQISFNKRDFKLSVLAHARAYFRGLVFVASKDKTDKYKLVVPSFVESSLNPTGTTAKYLNSIKTFEDWSKVEGVQNISVVDGLGLHHGSQEYYLPVF